MNNQPINPKQSATNKAKAEAITNPLSLTPQMKIARRSQRSNATDECIISSLSASCSIENPSSSLVQSDYVHVSTYVEEKVKEMAEVSRVVNTEKEMAIPRFDAKEIVLGKLLGRGGFSNVYEVRRFDLQDPAEEEILGCSVGRVCKSFEPMLEDKTASTRPSSSGDDSDSDSKNCELAYPTFLRKETKANFAQYHQKARSFLAEHCLRQCMVTKNTELSSRYAFKCLRPDIILNCEGVFEMAAKDLAVEAKFLSCLQHPNIVKIRGMARNDIQAFTRGMSSLSYFLVMDALEETLDRRLKRWTEESRRGWLFRKRKDRKGIYRKELLIDRLKVALDIASALCYLHDLSIIFRDLKPENVGFDVRGDAKLFDFGFAKELRDDERVNNDSNKGSTMCHNAYEMSAPCGSYRYMAPEVIQRQPYNVFADVYSFGTILYQICSLKKPYEGFSIDKLQKYVAPGLYRPPLPKKDNVWPEDLTKLIRQTWSTEWQQRPDIKHAHSILSIILYRCGSNASDTGPLRTCRRSTYVLPSFKFGKEELQ